MRLNLVILLICLSVPMIGMSQTMDWQQASNWRLYDTIGSADHFTIDSLNNYRYINLDQASMRGFLINDSLLPSERTKNAVWMGFYRVSCRIADKTKILIVSRYGGFFADLATRQYYQIPISQISDWNAYLDTQFSDLHKSTAH